MNYFFCSNIKNYLNTTFPQKVHIMLGANISAELPIEGE